MAKSINYRVKLYPAHKDGAFTVTKFEVFGTYPQKDITAAGMPDLINQVSAFANRHGQGCRASVRCLAPRKPPGFDKATEDLYFNLEERSIADDHPAAVEA